MLTNIEIRNFKRFEHVNVELGQTVVLIGPNNSGKTTVLQALALWYVGLRKWQAITMRRGLRDIDDSSTIDSSLGERGVAINRLDLNAVPVPSAKSLWNDLRTVNGDDRIIRVSVRGVTHNTEWECAFNFWFGNDESLTVLPGQAKDGAFFVPEEANSIDIAFLPPMSGLIAQEDRLERGSIWRRIGEGRTAEVLRNLCWQVYEKDPTNWNRLSETIRAKFDIELLAPFHDDTRGLLQVAYRERTGVVFDLSASGRGMLQVLLLLTFMYNNSGSVLLLDEPDAHLEILRQRQIYELLTTVAQDQRSQIIAASHSEIILTEAADRDIVIAFVGEPHRIDRSRTSQVAKSLKEIDPVDYYQAEQRGWVLYLEGSTDLAILRALAQHLNHEAVHRLEDPFVNYLHTNKPSKAADHFQGLNEAKPDLVGVALFDRIPRNKLQGGKQLTELVWQRREIENYIALPDSLIAYAQDKYGEAGQIVMRDWLSDNVPPAALRDLTHPFWTSTKATDGFLDILFEAFFKRLGIDNLLHKTNYHVLADYVPTDQIDPEITEKLDAIVAVARQARPRED